ncbi:MAG: type I-F CRISPR-associated endonuclease Cas1f [Marivita sp.]|uniref:type I-F CRISPR-associated endonuclease Cas1f n=1 Tax=Marivita sp. TaxID=2003365 RepID=UPI0025C1B503|nr:type I-F CRISPR-associated endonuclease Cas1f [Marivita sp.]MCI5112771.1 type I-F CRISPR-associated endonuclease Cas1f [Marivita sp.]
MQHKGGPRLLVTDREGALYLERARIHVEDGRITYHVSDDEYRREYNIPHVNLAVLFIGQGTSITQDAMRLLAEEGVYLAVTGTGGTPLHMGSLTAYTATRHFRDMLPVYLDEARSLQAAKIVMRDRAERMRKMGGALAGRHLGLRDPTPLARICKTFEDRLASITSIQELLGVEGQFAKSCYKFFAEASGLSKTGEFRRLAGVGMSDDDVQDKGAPADLMRLVNRFIDHGNYLAYGMAGSALWALGIPPHMSVFHGKTRAGGLVFDLADSFKDALVLPIAFAAVRNRKDKDPEKVFRDRLIAAFDDRKILAEAIATVERMIASPSAAPSTKEQTDA